jgi:hypothetical protein
MKVFRIQALVLFISMAMLTSYAQQSTPGQPPIATAAAPIQAFTEQIRNTVAFLTVAYQDGPKTMAVIGTCFFVWVPDNRLGENQGFVYLVTNRHVAQPGIDIGANYPVLGISLRLNLVTPRGEIQSVQEQIPMGNQLRWYFPLDGAVDLAILPLAPNQKIYAYQLISSS